MKNKRPHIICLMMTSVDGKILGHTWGNSPKVKKLIANFEQAHETFGINAWICGRSTMEKDFTDGTPPIYEEGTDSITREDFIAKADASSFAIAVDGYGKLGWKSATLHGDHVITILTESVPDAYLRHLKSIGVSYIFAGEESLDLTLAVEKIRSHFKIEKLMLEGGGHLNGSFLNEGLVDEFHQLLLPIADGKADTATVFEVENSTRKEESTLLKLKSVKTLDDDVLWLHYTVEN